MTVSCSFCGKNPDEVRKIVGPPEGRAPVYICDECVDHCNDVIAQECAAGSDEEPGDQELVGGTPVRCILCFLPKDPSEIRLIPDRGALCTVCLDAIRDAIEA